jgi:hypothetical protein
MAVGKLLLSVGVALLLTTPARAQSAEHVAAVKAAQGAAFMRANAANGCPLVGEDFLGWPGNLVRRCEYAQGNLTALVYLLDIEPERVAQWIEAGCAENLPDVAACFNRILGCGVQYSSMAFPVSGNVLENKNDTSFKNTFFRNGMTIASPHNGKSDQISIEEQDKLARAPDAEISGLPTGAARYWRTLARHLAAKAMDIDVPSELNTKERRQRWLDVVKSETLAALGRPTNRLLNAWMAAHPITLRSGDCPDDRDP